MVKSIDGTIEFIGLDKNDNCPMTTSIRNNPDINSSFLSNINTCARTLTNVPNWSEYYTREFEMRELNNPDSNARGIIIMHCTSSGPVCCTQKAYLGGDVYLTSFLTHLWPTMKEYKCNRNAITGIYECIRTDLNEDLAQITLEVFKDDSFAELNVQATYTIKAEEIVEPEVSDMNIKCDNGVCDIDFKKQKGNYVTIKFSECGNDIITNSTKEKIYCFSDCNQIVEAKVTFQDKIIQSTIGRLNCTKSINYELATGKPKGLDINLPSIDIWRFLYHLAFYWYYYLIGLIVMIFIILVIYFWFFYKKIKAVPINSYKTLFNKKLD